MDRKYPINTVLFPERSWIHSGSRLDNKLFKPNPMPCVSMHLSRSDTLWTSRKRKLTDHGKLFDRYIVDSGQALSVFLGHSVDISDEAIMNQCLCRPFWIISVFGGGVRCRIAWASLARELSPEITDLYRNYPLISKFGLISILPEIFRYKPIFRYKWVISI
jgi:hypothetical protein